jgi:hypothetical protein
MKIDRYEEAGVHRLIPTSNATSLDEALRFVDEIGEIASAVTAAHSIVIRTRSK